MNWVTLEHHTGKISFRLPFSVFKGSVARRALELLAECRIPGLTIWFSVNGPKI